MLVVRISTFYSTDIDMLQLTTAGRDVDESCLSSSRQLPEGKFIQALQS